MFLVNEGLVGSPLPSGNNVGKANVAKKELHTNLLVHYKLLAMVMLFDQKLAAG